jgi:hypothetical protein
MDDLRFVPVGTDRFRAQVIAEACRVAGLKVKLLLSDDSGYGAVQPHRLLVRSDELEQVLTVVKKSDSDGRPDRPDLAP